MTRFRWSMALYGAALGFFLNGPILALNRVTFAATVFVCLGVACSVAGVFLQHNEEKLT